MFSSAKEGGALTTIPCKDKALHEVRRSTYSASLIGSRMIEIYLTDSHLKRYVLEINALKKTLFDPTVAIFFCFFSLHFLTQTMATPNPLLTPDMYFSSLQLLVLS